MGRGNWLPYNSQELEMYDGFYVGYEGIYGERYFEEDVYDTGEIEDFIDLVEVDLKNKFKDLYEVNIWRSRDERIHLEDGPIKLVMGDNESAIAVYFILEEMSPEDYSQEEIEEYWGKIQVYVRSLEEILVNNYKGYVYKRTGAWTSDRVG